MAAEDSEKKEIKKSDSRTTRWLLIVAGTICVGLGILGIFLPVLPTTPFLLLAAACYVRSSDKFYKWLLTNRVFGNYIRNYREQRAVPMKIKIFTILLLWAAIIYSAFFAVKIIWVSIILVAIAIGVTIHILSIKTLKK